MLFKRLVIGIILLSFFTNFYNLERRHSFDWDQERDADVVYTRIIKEKKPTLIGPRVVGPEGFFLGPLHYYILVPFYLVAGGDPIAGPLSAGTVGVMTTLAYVYVAGKLFGKRTAIVAGVLSALAPSIVSWNVMYMPVVSLLTYYTLTQVINGNVKLIIPVFILIALAFQSHFTAIFLLISTLITIFLSAHRMESQKKYVLTHSIFGIGILLVSFAPLLLFDLRHDFLNIKNIISFFLGSASGEGGSLDFFNSPRIFLRNSHILTPLAHPILNQLINITLVVIAIYETFRIKKKDLRVFNSVWILLPIILLGFYRGEISEYYFVTITAVLVLYLALFVSKISRKKNISLFIALIMLILATLKVYSISIDRGSISLYQKKHLMASIAKEINSASVGISYHLPLGMDVGFKYLFMFYGLNQIGTAPNQEYIIYLHPNVPDAGTFKRYGDFYLVKK